MLAMLALVGLSGCYLSRLREEPGDGGGRDARIVPADARPPPLDAALRCPVVRADFMCLPSLIVQPGRPFTLPLSFDTLACCAQAECAVTVDASSHTLRLTTTLCADVCDCAPTNTPVAECAVPALTDGNWIVEVNGGAAHRLVVTWDSGFAPAPPACWDFAEVDECTGAMAIDGRPQRASSTCALRSAATERYAVDVTDTCGSCDHESVCEVTLEPRPTFEFPPGGDLHVRPLRFTGACDGACPEVCMLHTRRCEVPPLVDGEFYRVFVHGVLQLSFTAGTDTNVCGGALEG